LSRAFSATRASRRVTAITFRAVCRTSLHCALSAPVRRTAAQVISRQRPSSTTLPNRRCTRMPNDFSGRRPATRTA
jgi:hypothetical protein